MKSIIVIKIELKDGAKSLRDLTCELYSLYVHRKEESSPSYSYTTPDLPSGYDARTKGKFDSDLQTPIVHERRYYEYGSRGGIMFYLNTFKVEEAKFEIIENSIFTISIECPAEDIAFINEFLGGLNQESLKVNSTFRIDETPIKKGLTYDYFYKMLDSIKYLDQSFNLYNDYNDPVLEVNMKDRKEVLFSSTDERTQIKVIFWRKFHPEINRNSSGLSVSINQAKNTTIPENFKFYLHQLESYHTEQLDLTVDRCTLEVEEHLDKSTMEAIEAALQTYLLGLEML